ncbi:hypothetical protein SH528x_002234 [Novipirellula sp. SH528]|uniref:hypothetical protein n=1 Tax=Novipirellula sp. SH528 TaxID=3454466 RepID=UPI003F9FFEA2
MLSEAVTAKLADIAIDAANDLESRQRRIQALDGCINKLSNRERMLVEKHYRQLLAISAIAQSEGKGLSTIYERL